MAKDGTVKIGTEIDDNGFKSGLAKLGNVAKAGLKAGITAISGVATAAAGAVAGLLALEQSTEEYRIAQGKLNTAFEAAGFSAETAQDAYQGFYRVLGDTDTATEASQLLAKLARSEEDVSTWTKIAAGVNGTFGDSLPIEGLIESANETAKVGKVTGVLADALNWAGISEDEFNAKLEAAGSEAERNQLIMNTLSGEYNEAAEAFERNNKTLIQSRENQMLLDDTLASLGETISNVKNGLISEFLPSIASVVTAFNNLLNGVEGADEALSTAIQDMVTKAVEKLPEFLSFGVDIVASIVRGIVQNLPQLLDGAVQIVQELASAIISLLPDLLEAGGSILTYIADGFETGVPDLISKLPEMVSSFADYIKENLPIFMETGVEIVNSVVNGIINAIPAFVEAWPQIWLTFTDFLAESYPQMISAGFDIVSNLIAGLIQAIPALIESIPQIVTAIVENFGNSVELVLNVGRAIIEGIAKGIVTGIPKLIEVLPLIGEAILEVLGSLGDIALDIGKNLVLGIGAGIENAIDWLLGVVGDFADSVMSAIKDFFGIHSPSKKTEYVGDMLDAGVGAGIEKNVGKIKSAIHKMDIMGELEKAIPSVEQKVNVATSAMTPMSVTAPNPVPQTSGGSGAGGGTSYQRVIIGFKESNPRGLARYLKPYIDKEEKLDGMSMVEGV